MSAGEYYIQFLDSSNSAVGFSIILVIYANNCLKGLLGILGMI